MDNEPPQDKTSYSGRFLDSHSFARNDMSGGGFVLSTRVVIATFPERHTGRSLRFRWEVLPLRLLFLQCGAWYRASSTAYGGSPSPKGKVLAFYLCAGCSCNAERGTAPHPPPMAVPLPRRGRFWRSTSAPIVPAMNIAVPPLILAGIPCLSLWERWPSAARTERGNVEDTNHGPLSHLW